MSPAHLCTPLRVGSLELANRIVIAPMCQYSAQNGCMTDWHSIHLGHLALSGAALLTVEATAVSPEGRITYADVGLYSDETETAMARVLDLVRRWSDMPIAIQLAHAGRKASTEKPWLGGAQIPADQPNGWPTLAPSAVPFAANQAPPAALDAQGMAKVRQAFAETAVGLITEFEQAEAIIGTGDADLIALARAMLYDPRWPWHAAAHFGAEVKAPDQYLRSQPRQHSNLFAVRAKS